MTYRRERAAFAVGFLLLLLTEVLIALFVHDGFVRPYLGDVFVVILLFCLIRIFVPRGLRLLPLYLFLFAAAVEISQYFHFVSLIGLAGNKPAETIFGTSFSVWDIVCYLAGCLVCALIDFRRTGKQNIRKEKRKRKKKMKKHGIFDRPGELETGRALDATEEWEAIRPRAVLMIEAGENRFYASLKNNASSKALTERLNAGGITLVLSKSENGERTAVLPWQLPAEEPITESGNVILRQGNRIAFCPTARRDGLAPLAEIGESARDRFLDALGDGDAAVSLSLEWSE